MTLRNERVRKALMREISDVIFKLNDPDITGIVSITDVDVSSDNTAARVFYSVFTDDEIKKKKTSEILERRVPQIRHEIGKRIRLRKTPSLLFILDDSLEHGAKMTELINKIERGEL